MCPVDAPDPAAHDPYLSVTLAARQREAFPSAELAVLHDSGHWPHADSPDAVGCVVEPFRRRAVGADRVAAASAQLARYRPG